MIEFWWVKTLITENRAPCRCCDGKHTAHTNIKDLGLILFFSFLKPVNTLSSVKNILLLVYSLTAV